MKKKKKIGCVRFQPNAVIICSGKKEGFDCKNNQQCNKLANFLLDNISKMNYRISMVLSYISSRFRLQKVNWSRRSLSSLPYYNTIDSKLLPLFVSFLLDES